MSGILFPILLIAGLVALVKRCEWFGVCGDNTGATAAATNPTVIVTPDGKIAPVTKVTPTSKIVANAPTGDKYLVTAADNKLGPANCASSAHEADKGFGFSKDGGPVEADGFTADEGEPRVGDNRNNQSRTIAELPGPCETKPYKGKVQYRHAGLSASCETCVLAKRYFLYKYGIGGVNPIPGTNGGEGIREGGARGPGVKTIVPQRAVKGAKAKFVRIAI